MKILLEIFAKELENEPNILNTKTMKTQKTISLFPQFIASKEDITSYEALPENMPDTKLTQKQKDLVASFYYKYIRSIDNADWSQSLVDMEMAEKWPSGPRMKRHEAQRIVLNNFFAEQSRNGMTFEVAMKHFFIAMTCRKAYSRMVSKIWNVYNN